MISGEGARNLQSTPSSIERKGKENDPPRCFPRKKDEFSLRQKTK